MPKRLWLGLIVLMCLGLGLRLYGYKTLAYPPSGDEVAFGYYGWSLLHFGSDEFGHKLPVYFQSIGDFKYPLLAYLNIIPAAFFGLSDITVRFWSIMAGTFLIGSVGYLTYLLWKKESVSFLSGLVLAVMPWALIMSRASYEANIALFLMTWWVIFYKLRKLKPLMALSVAIMYCYSATRVVLPALAFFLAISDEDRTKRRGLLGLFFVLVILAGAAFIPWASRARAEGTLLRMSGEDENALKVSYIQAGISPTQMPLVFTRLMHNKFQVMGMNFVKEYVGYFAPDFWFFTGKANNEGIPGAGVLLLVQLIILPVGLISAYKKSGSRLLYIWLFCAPAAAFLTGNGPNLVRACFMLVPLAAFSGYGFVALSERREGKSKLFVFGITCLLFIASSVYFLGQYFVNKTVDQPWQSAQGTREMYQEVSRLKDQYKAIVLPNDDYIYMLFYNKISPETFLANSEILPTKTDDHWERVNRYDKFIFKMPFQCPKAGRLNTLYVCVGTNIPQNAKIIKVFRFNDGLPHFTLITYMPYVEADKTNKGDLPDRLHYMIDRDGLYPLGYIPEEKQLYW